jgi:hypothetical protein
MFYVRFNHFRAVKIPVKRVFDSGHGSLLFAVVCPIISANGASLGISLSKWYGSGKWEMAP